MEKSKFAVIGTGFWAYYQLKGWQELGNAVPIAFYNKTISKAKALAEKFEVSNVYDDIDLLLDTHAHELDFVDINFAFRRYRKSFQGKGKLCFGISRI